MSSRRMPRVMPAAWRIRIPRRLFPGDTIAVVAPSSPFDPQRLRGGVTKLESMGLKVRLPPGLDAATGYLAGSDVHRAQALMDALQDPAVQAVVCARGGYGAMRLLERIDFEKLSDTPKLIVGFSDVTALLAAFWRCCRWVTIHGPTVVGLADADPATEAILAQVLMGTVPIVLPATGMLVPGKASGVLVGGNLTILCHLIGTPFFPSLSRRILLLEDRGEALYRIDRMLHQLHLAGALDNLAGLVLGQFDGCGPPARLERLICELLGDRAIPVVTGVPVGHGARNWAVPLGLPAKLDAERMQIEIAPLPAEVRVAAR